MKLIPAPGTYVAEEIKEEGPVLTGQKKAQIKKGRVIAVGEPDYDKGMRIPVAVKVGDIVFFLSYEGAYDEFYIDGKTYFTIVGKDHRVVMKK